MKLQAFSFKWLLVCVIRTYQKVPLFSHSFCRYTPTCSQYTLEAVKKYGSVKGLWLGFKRILRCTPFSKGGYDPLK